MKDKNILKCKECNDDLYWEIRTKETASETERVSKDICEAFCQVCGTLYTKPLKVVELKPTKQDENK